MALTFKLTLTQDAIRRGIDDVLSVGTNRVWQMGARASVEDVLAVLQWFEVPAICLGHGASWQVLSELACVEQADEFVMFSRGIDRSVINLCVSSYMVGFMQLSKAEKVAVHGISLDSLTHAGIL